MNPNLLHILQHSLPAAKRRYLAWRELADLMSFREFLTWPGRRKYEANFQA